MVSHEGNHVATSIAHFKYVTESIICKQDEMNNCILVPSLLYLKGMLTILCFKPKTQPPLWFSGRSCWLKIGDVSCFLWGTIWIYICCVEESRPPLWSSGQSSWLHNGDVSCFLWGTNCIYICYVEESRPPLWSSGQSRWLQFQSSRVRYPALPDFLSSGCGTGSTRPRE
jgi:hypothetical protein